MLSQKTIDSIFEGVKGKEITLTQIRTALAALQTATVNPARYFGIQQTAGNVASGQRADLVLLDANPLADIANVQQIRAVVIAGRFLDRRELDGVLAQVREAAKQH